MGRAEGYVTSETTHYVTVFANDAFKLRCQKYMSYLTPKVSINNLIVTVGFKSFRIEGIFL